MAESQLISAWFKRIQFWIIEVSKLIWILMINDWWLIKVHGWFSPQPFADPPIVIKILQNISRWSFWKLTTLSVTKPMKYDAKLSLNASLGNENCSLLIVNCWQWLYLRACAEKEARPHIVASVYSLRSPLGNAWKDSSKLISWNACFHHWHMYI